MSLWSLLNSSDMIFVCVTDIELVHKCPVLKYINVIWVHVTDVEHV